MKRTIFKAITWALIGAAFVTTYSMLGLPGLYIGYVAGSFWVALPIIYWICHPDWWMTRMGRALMMLLGSLAALFILIITSGIFGATPLREVFRIVIYSAVLVAAVRLAVLFFQLRIGADWHNDKRGNDG
ncbi:hypothetical protein SAMN04487917_101330 [Arthrobacter sp. yr096]|uniref:putative phage holin n=1 Tax=Arthrobacter sp. yr096 TaxID=1761750 RepID=UPI0008D10554|nr:hypothetical protein [Arthrobacter sp. yr096]SEI44538.1 hypothetical protein SAMN04487917_101330 [Arthrobacter sp. yr096]